MAKLQQGMAVDMAPTEAVIQPGLVHQECARLQTGENVRYAFEASAPVGVSLSYDNEGKQVFAVSETEQQTSLMQRFTAEAPHTYCVNWHNTGKQAITVKYRYTPEYHMQTMAPARPVAF
jgi:hypothetical protein